MQQVEGFARNRREIEEVVSIARTLDVERPQPVLEQLMPALRRLLRSDYAVAYRPVEGDGTPWRLDFVYVDKDPRETAIDEPLRDFVARTPGRFVRYDPLRPDPRERNLVVRPRAGMDERTFAEMPMVRDFLSPHGLDRLDQLRALLCDGPTLLAWFGGMRRDRFSDDDVAALDAVLPSVRARLLLERRLSRASFVEKGLIATLELLPSAAFLVAPDGSIAFANDVGRALLDWGSRDLRARLKGFARGAKLEPGMTRISIGGKGLPACFLVTLAVPVPEIDRARRLSVARERWGLTPRQLMVLELVAQGDANKAIAEKLRCSDNTVEVHVSAIFRKARVENRAALVAKFWTRID